MPKALALLERIEEVKQEAAAFMKVRALWRFFEAERHCTKAGLDLAIVNSEKLERFASLPEQERIAGLCANSRQFNRSVNLQIVSN